MYKNNILKLISFFFLLTVLFSCKKNSSEFNISGELINVEGPVFYAAYQIGDSLVVDTVKISSKGEFEIKGSVDTLTIVRMYFNQNTKTPNLYVFADKNWNVKLKGDILYPDLIEVKGGDVNNDLTAFKENNHDLLMNRSKILEAASQDSNSVKDDQKYIMNLKNLNFELSNIAAAYVQKNPDKIASVVLINAFFRDESSLSRLEENLDLLRGKAETFPLTIDLKKYNEKTKRTLVGTRAPSFSMKDINGKLTNLQQFKGQYVLLSFLSTTCDICNVQRKDMVKAYEQLKKDKKNINFVSIVIDDEEKPITKAVRDSMTWTILPEKGSWSAKTFELYNINEVPYNILIDPNGIILEKDIPIEAVAEKLENLKKTEN